MLVIEAWSNNRPNAGGASMSGKEKQLPEALSGEKWASQAQADVRREKGRTMPRGSKPRTCAVEVMAPPLGTIRHRRGELALWGPDPKSGLSQSEFGVVTKQPGWGRGGVYRQLEIQSPAGKWFLPAPPSWFCDDQGEKLGPELWFGGLHLWCQVGGARKVDKVSEGNHVEKNAVGPSAESWKQPIFTG